MRNNSKLSIFTYIVFLTIAVVIFPILSNAQTVGDNQVPVSNAAQSKPNLIRMLNLSPDQIAQVRSINKEMGVLMAQAAKRLREAKIALDQAIYSDVPDENNVEIRLAEFSQAQADVAKTRAIIEFRIRKVLTQEQLTKFRDLRAELAEKKKNNNANTNARPFLKQIQTRRNQQKQLPVPVQTPNQ